MTTSTAEGQPPATTAHAVASHEWSEAFGDLDLEYTAPDSPTTHSHTAPTPAASSASPDQQLNIVEPLWFLQTDEEAATRPFADDGKSRWREILNFRVDRWEASHVVVVFVRSATSCHCPALTAAVFDVCACVDRVAVLG